MSGTNQAAHAAAVAVIGMAGRFPGARDVDAFWSNLRDGVHSVRFFSDEELAAAGVPARHREMPGYVGAAGRLDDIDRFDAGFFGFNPREAEVLDPQHRVFLETAWEAMENAGYDPGSTRETVGIYAGSSDSDYLARHVMPRRDVVEAVGGFQVALANSTAFLATRAAHKLNLRGPALNLQTACSTGLVAVHVACQALAAGECDMALAGGVSINVNQDLGYLHTPGGIGSPDGHCRAFDARAAGTVPGSGAGVVVLKLLEDALADGDTIHAVVRGSAINNDGARKVGFTAPGVDGQAAVIGEALAVGGIDPETVGYVEGHGSGTGLGDPVEVAALTQAFGRTRRKQFCALGSVKTSVGHLDSAAGAAGFIKAALAVEHGEIPASLHYTAPNPEIDFGSSPFYVNAALRPWPEGATPRRAGVSSFGLGGTNAHVVLEQPPAPRPSAPARDWQLLALSARTPQALEAATDRLAAHLRAHPEQALADVAWTLQAGRRAWEHRRVLVARGHEDAAAALEERAPERVLSAAAPEGPRPVSFLFPGPGSHYAGMGRGLYEAEPVYRETVDRCAEILRPHLGVDLREALYPPKPDEDDGIRPIDARRGRSVPDDVGAELDDAGLGHPALFVTQYALGRMWMSWGIRPAAMAAHSLGEYAAATLAGVWSLEDALLLCAERARLIHALPRGGMMGIARTREDARPFLREGVCVGAMNGPEITVLSGLAEDIDALQAEMAARGIGHRRLPHRWALHSELMRPVAEHLEGLMRGMRLHAPSIPFVSNVTGDWIRPGDATDPAYWTRHLCGTVQYHEGIGTLARSGRRVMLEIGPGHAMRMLASQLEVWGGDPPAFVGSLRHGYEHQPDVAHALGALGELWTAGAAVDWRAVHAHERLRRVPLPTYPFERTRYWIDRASAAPAEARAAGVSADAAESADWLYLPAWTRAPLPAPGVAEPAGWLVLADAAGIGSRLAGRLEALGHRVAVAEAGDGFARVGERGYTARPGSRDDLSALREAVHAGGIRPRHVVHLWGIDPEGAEAPDALERAQARGGDTVGALAAAFARDGDPLRVVVVTEGVQDVAGGETVRPERAAVLGACLGLPLEHPNATCRTVDVRLRPGGGRLVDALLAEVAPGVEEETVALRGPVRWVRGYPPARAPRGAAGLRPGGACLFSAGVGDGAALLARHLAAAPGARLAVVVDPGFPERKGWDAHLQSAPAGDDAAATIRTLRAAEAAGARVLLLRAAFGDAAALRAAVAEARGAFGELHGVVHDVSAGAAVEPAALAQARPGAAAAALARAERELAALREAVAGVPLEWVILQNTLASVLGAAGFSAFAARCALADAWAQRAAAEDGAPWSSVSWDHWNGDAADGPAASGIPFDEGARAWEGVAALAGEPRVVVSTLPPAARLQRLRAPNASPAAVSTDGGEEKAALHPRPRLGNDYHAPDTVAEELLAGVWQELLGIDRIGIHDDFFRLGGHSLLGMQLVSRVRDTFQVELPLAAIFEAPTVAALAELIDEAILLELEELSDDEALAQAGGSAA